MTEVDAEVWGEGTEEIGAGSEPSEMGKLNCFQVVTFDNSLVTVEVVVWPTFPLLTSANGIGFFSVCANF